MSFRLEQLEQQETTASGTSLDLVTRRSPGPDRGHHGRASRRRRAEVVKTIPYQIPVGAPRSLNLTLSDGNTLNFPDFAGIAQIAIQTSAAEMIDAVNRYRDSDSLYVRIWRQQPAFNVAGPMPGGELTDPPPSVALVLADTSSSVSSGATATARGSDVAQLKLSVNGYVVTGAKTIQIEVKD